MEGVYIAEIKAGTGEQQRFPIIPMNEKELLVPGLGRGLGETILVRSVNGEEVIEYSGLLFKKKD